MRKFNYTKDYSIISSAVVGYIKQLTLELEWLIKNEENNIYVDALQELENFKNKYPNLQEISSLIFNDLLSEYNVSYCFKHNEYPSDASIIGMEFEKDLKRIFDLEDELRDVAVFKWKNRLTKFDDIVNGEPFMIVGHASYLLPGTKNCGNYRENSFSKLYLSCSLLSNKEFNTFNSIKTFFVTNVNEDNYISSSSFDSVTADMSSPSFETLKVIASDDKMHYIKVGYSNDKEKSVTTISTPDLIEQFTLENEIRKNGELFKYENSLTCEIVLDRTTTNVTGALLLSDGCDLLLNEYIFLKQNNMKFKCLNKGLYREQNGLTPYTEKELSNFLQSIKHLNELIISGKLESSILLDYYNEVVIPMGYSKEIEDMIRENFSKYVILPEENINNKSKN